MRDSAEQWRDNMAQTVASQPRPALLPEVLEAGFKDMITAVFSRVGMTGLTDKDVMICACQQRNHIGQPGSHSLPNICRHRVDLAGG